MKLLTFYSEGQLKPGVLTNRGILDISGSYPTMIEAIERYRGLDEFLEFALEEESDFFLDQKDLELGPAIDCAEKIICVGLNYRKHAEESGMPAPDYPILFSKYRNSLSGSGETVGIPLEAEQVDYEAELAIVMGKTAKNITEEEAEDYIFGYCAANDLSERSFQFRSGQWLLGKSLDGFCPLGPYIVTADEIEDPNKLRIRASVNGEIRQDSNTNDMIFKCEALVSYISHYMTLKPGDVILTGTPEGVALGYPEDSRPWLRDGDVVTVEIEDLGSLVTHMEGE
ncbi:fumarylacetoacetate hydrolase family protein [Salinicoccus sp. ID82-1]|uniref:fumarylacetoacetate hydrolase family protein n=1 Tax=Salinicoccus sp. ID82-1 TaxID=2820269 RepID=UPI001F2E312E|nr:fumarylacetoacetate hydrolase family protein [Salinicoccus sp. ID82-1]MCG1009637.1 fumarylacetoacetate hydrolase family protein [Salinicoccus sp. ID82-1]